MINVVLRTQKHVVYRNTKNKNYQGNLRRVKFFLIQTDKLLNNLSTFYKILPSNPITLMWVNSLIKIVDFHQLQLKPILISHWFFFYHNQRKNIMKSIPPPLPACGIPQGSLPGPLFFVYYLLNVTNKLSKPLFSAWYNSLVFPQGSCHSC